MEKEIWKDVPGYEGKYRISSFGRVMSLKRNGIPKDTIVAPHMRGNYLCVGLRDKTRTFVSIHRLVATVFVPNPLGLPQVDHIDGDKINNLSSNLRWVTAKENINNPVTRAYHRAQCAKNRNNWQSKAIEQRDMDGNLIATYPSIREAARVTGIEKSNISAAAHNKRRYATDHWATIRSAGGYKWNFKE